MGVTYEYRGPVPWGSPYVFLTSRWIEQMFLAPPIRQGMLGLDRLRWLGMWLPVAGIGILIVLLEGLVLSLDLPWQGKLVGHVAMLGP